MVEATTDAALVIAAKRIAQKIGRKSWVVMCVDKATTRKLGSLSYDTVGKRIQEVKREIGKIMGDDNWKSIQVLKPWKEYRNSSQSTIPFSSTNDNTEE